MKTISLKFFSIGAIVAIEIIQPGCKKNNDTPIYDVKLATSSTLGQYLADKNGNTLYMFANDFNGRTSCTGSCANLWPLFSVSGLTQDKLGPGLDISDFDTIHVNGIVQLRYKTWPLYYYAPGTGYNGENVREPAGQINGDGLNNVWFLAKPDYSIMLGNGQLVGNDNQDYKGDYTVGTGKTLYFTDGRGNTLYTFSKDSLNVNKFTKSDFSNNTVWPIYEMSVIVVPSSLNKALFGKITVYGRTQLTYKGWPLYYFGGDKGVHGNNKGVSVPVPGIWPVAVAGLSSPPSKPQPPSGY